jgi:hypothetical protein
VDLKTGFEGLSVVLVNRKCNAFERELNLEVLGGTKVLGLDQLARWYRSANERRTYKSWRCAKSFTNQADGSYRFADTWEYNSALLSSITLRGPICTYWGI